MKDTHGKFQGKMILIKFSELRTENMKLAHLLGTI